MKAMRPWASGMERRRKDKGALATEQPVIGRGTLACQTRTGAITHLTLSPSIQNAGCQSTASINDHDQDSSGSATAPIFHNS